MKYARVAGDVAIALAILGCLTALAASVVPGLLDDLLFPAMFLLILALPVVVIGAVVAIVLVCWRRLRLASIPWKRAVLILMIFAGAFILLKFYVPCRIAFAVSRSAFEELVMQSPKPSRQRAKLNRRLGVYRVDEYAADPRGGVYFRVHSGGDGIGPDLMSYGFAYRPNKSGTPFGAAHYRLFTLGGDWYCFRASDDWF
jgi:hypothetical protein